MKSIGKGEYRTNKMVMRQCPLSDQGDSEALCLHIAGAVQTPLEAHSMHNEEAENLITGSSSSLGMGREHIERLALLWLP